MASSLIRALDCTATPGTRGAPAPVAPRRRVARVRLAPRCQWRPLTARAQAAATQPDPEHQAPANGGPSAFPTTALKVGAGVALALALGGASWRARGGSAGPVLMQPAAVCSLNVVTDSASRATAERSAAAAATMRTSVDALSDSLLRREDAPRDRATLMDLVFEQVTKEVFLIHHPDPFLDSSFLISILARSRKCASTNCVSLVMRSKSATGES